MKTLITIGLLLLATVAPGQTPGDSSYEALATVVLPKGDANHGRQAFHDLKCYLCHRVAGERTFPPPVAEARGPDLDATLRMQDASDIAAAIIVPSHSSSVRTSDAVRKMLAQQMKSPMADFSGVLTVRQLADLLAYLRSVR